MGLEKLWLVGTLWGERDGSGGRLRSRHVR